MGQHDNEPDDLVAVVIGIHIGDEDSINFQGINWKARESAQRRIPRAEIIDAETDTKSLQFGKDRQSTIRVSHRDGFHDLKIDSTARNSGFLQHLADISCYFWLR